MRPLALLCILLTALACSNPSREKQDGPPRIGFLDFLEDATLSQAKKGFFVALNDSGFSPTRGSLEVIYRNAQGDQPTLLQACDYILSQDVELIATNPTLSTITAVQRTKQVPVFMMVSPRPDIAKLTDASGRAPANLFGTYETLEYIDTSLMLVSELFPNAKRIGTIFNQSEPQSIDALNAIEKRCASLGLTLEKLPVNNSNETQLVMSALLDKKVDVFFALPDNTVFSSMEVIVSSCDKAGVPVFTSEEGLVKRGAIAAFGADMYQWGYQSGAQSAHYLINKNMQDIRPELVRVRRKVFNPEKAKRFGLTPDSTYTAVAAE
ncbi:MAG: ABC transporter substrate-binding protein [Bacteroidota bacterium]